MPVTIDAISYNNGKDVTSLTKSHTTSSGPNRFMLVGVSSSDGHAVSSATYDGQSLTKIAHAQDGSNISRSEIWRITNPNSGAANVVVNFGATATGATMSVITFEGVDQISPVGTAVTAAANDGNASLSVSGTLSTDLVFDHVTQKDAKGISVGSGQTERTNVPETESSKNTGGTSTEPGNGGSVTMSWSFTDTGLNWSQVGVAIHETVGYANDMNSVPGGDINSVNGVSAPDIETINTV